MACIRPWLPAHRNSRAGGSASFLPSLRCTDASVATTGQRKATSPQRCGHPHRVRFVTERCLSTLSTFILTYNQANLG